MPAYDFVLSQYERTSNVSCVWDSTYDIVGLRVRCLSLISLFSISLEREFSSTSICNNVPGNN